MPSIKEMEERLGALEGEFKEAETDIARADGQLQEIEGNLKKEFDCGIDEIEEKLEELNAKIGEEEEKLQAKWDELTEIYEV